MRYRKPGLRLQNISKSEGKIEWVLGMFLIVFLMIFMLAELQIMKYKAASDCIEDAIAASGLASALIDTNIYSKEHKIVISEPEKAYSEYEKALATNLGARAEAAVIEKYIIYNVEDSDIEIITVDDRGVQSIDKGQKGKVYTPNGNMVQSTGVYNEISFEVEGIFGIVAKAQKGKLVEINVSEIVSTQ